MQKLVVAKVLAGAGIAVAAATAAAALETPDAADEGLTRAEESSGIEELPVAGALPDAPEDETVTVEEADEADEAETTELESDDVEAQGDGAQGEHGATVSATAQETEPGPDHGPAVAAVASDGRSEEGRANAAEARGSHGPEETDEADADTTETEEPAQGRRP